MQFAVLWCVKEQLAPGLAFSLSFLSSTAVHYGLNRFWALPSVRSDAGRQLVEYLGAVAVSYAVNLAVFSFVRRVWGLDPMWAAACALPPSTLVVFALLNYRIFRLAN
jgi:hypothetical protein